MILFEAKVPKFLMISAKRRVMGRYYWNNKQEAEYFKKISIGFIKKYGYLNHGLMNGVITFSRNGEKTGSVNIESILSQYEECIKFSYTQTDRDSGEKKDFDYKIQLTTTPCNFGGVRYWFICPLSRNDQYCGKRVGILYKAGDYFGCRHCYNLSYECRNLGGVFKAIGKIISEPELEESYKKIRCKYYAGKMTKRYKKWLIKSRKSSAQRMFMVNHLYGGIF